MPRYDAVAVFGQKLQKNKKFPAYVYRQLDEAARIASEQRIPRLAVCGARASDETRENLPLECDVAARYLDETHLAHAWEIVKEGESTSVLENWLYLRVTLRRLGLHQPRLLVVTLKPLLGRVRFLGQKVFGSFGHLDFKTLSTSVRFPEESRTLGNARCMLASMKPGDLSFLLDTHDRSKWLQLRIKHRSCPYAGKMHPS